VAHAFETSKLYRTSFTTGVAVQPDLHQLLSQYGEPTVKDTYNFKTIAKHENKYYSINVNLCVYDDGKISCDSVAGKENKVCIDQASMDQNKLDVRLALQFAEIIQEDHFLFPYAQELVNNVNVDCTSGTCELSYTMPPNMFVYTIRYKRRVSYTYESKFKIDVAEVRMVDYQHNLLVVQEISGIQRPVFDKIKTEVELSYIPWRKAFKFNKGMVGGNIGDYVKQKVNPQEWKAEELCKDLGLIIDEAVSLSRVIFAL